MLSRSANGIGGDPAGRSTGFCFGKSHSSDLSYGWIQELHASESKISWSSEQAAGRGGRRPPSLIKVRLQSESYFASRPAWHAESIPLFTHFCQICSVRGTPRAPHPLSITARAPRPRSHRGKAEGAAFLSHTSPAIRRCSQDEASYTGGGCRRQEKSRAALAKLHRSSRAGGTDLPAEQEDKTLEYAQGEEEIYGLVFILNKVTLLTILAL